MLVNVVKSGQYKPPKNTGALPDQLIRYTTPRGRFYDGPVTHAARLSPRDREIDFQKHTLEHLLRVQRALGDPWCETRDGERLILHKVAEGTRVGVDESVRAPKGLYAQNDLNYPLFKMADGKRGVVLESTFAGGKKGMGNAKLLPKLREMA
jgi:methionyl-tRNA formyltransferase